MDITLLRILTEKSIMKFGKYAESSVQQIIDSKNIHYLRYIYYNIEGISFSIDVLNKINIYPKFRIDKPGKNPDLFDEYCKYLELNIHGIEGKISILRNKSMKIAHITKYNKSTANQCFNKGLLQRYNQGHK